eukprot:9711285-Karenia_brevis.AAC.1
MQVVNIESHAAVQKQLKLHKNTKQEESIDQALQKEQKMRFACEECLDGEGGSLNRDADGSWPNTSTAQRMEYASHDNKSDGMKAATMESRCSLSKELCNHKVIKQVDSIDQALHTEQRAP